MGIHKNAELAKTCTSKSVHGGIRKSSHLMYVVPRPHKIVARTPTKKLARMPAAPEHRTA
jgi:hypothetical protein